MQYKVLYPMSGHLASFTRIVSVATGSFIYPKGGYDVFAKGRIARCAGYMILASRT